jgi:nucleoside-diphosphate-sugar epimerase
MPPIDIVQGTLDDADSLRAAAEGCEVVVHSAALLGGRIDQQRATNVEGTRCLMHAAADAGVRSFVHVSTLSVYGVCYDGLIGEDTHPPAPGTDPYGITKAEAEVVVREVGSARGIEYAILRPGMIYGPRAMLWTGTAFRLASLVPTPWIGSGGGLAHCIYVDDVCDMMALLATHPAAVGETFNCCSDPSPSWRTFLGEYARLARGVNDDWLELPPEIAYVIGGLVMLLSPPYSRGRMALDFITFVQKRAQFSMAKARQRLDWQPGVGIEEGVARCVDWLRSQGWLK